MATIRDPRCGDKNKADPGWPAQIKPGCGNALHVVQYLNANGKPSVCHLCPRCDGVRA